MRIYGQSYIRLKAKRESCKHNSDNLLSFVKLFAHFKQQKYARNRIKSAFLINEKFFQKNTKFVLTTQNRGAILGFAPRETGQESIAL